MLGRIRCSRQGKNVSAALSSLRCMPCFLLPLRCANGLLAAVLLHDRTRWLILDNYCFKPWIVEASFWYVYDVSKTGRLRGIVWDVEEGCVCWRELNILVREPICRRQLAYQSVARPHLIFCSFESLASRNRVVLIQLGSWLMLALLLVIRHFPFLYSPYLKLHFRSVIFCFDFDFLFSFSLF